MHVFIKTVDVITFPTVAQIVTNIPGIHVHTEQSRNDNWVKMSVTSVVSRLKTLSRSTDMLNCVMELFSLSLHAKHAIDYLPPGRNLIIKNARNIAGSAKCATADFKTLS